MTIMIESGVAILPARRTDRNKLTPSLKNLIARYSEAHKTIYGVPAQVHWENPWFRIVGVSTRVSRSRLLEMARQLEYRAG